MTELKDIFGVPLKAGDKVAVGMAYGRSSVLRVGEVLHIKEKDNPYGRGIKWAVRVKWTHNGSANSTWNVEESTILHESTHRYAKFVILPDGFVDQFPPDIEAQK